MKDLLLSLKGNFKHLDLAFGNNIKTIARISFLENQLAFVNCQLPG